MLVGEGERFTQLAPTERVLALQIRSLAGAEVAHVVA